MPWAGRPHPPGQAPHPRATPCLSRKVASGASVNRAKGKARGTLGGSPPLQGLRVSADIMLFGKQTEVKTLRHAEEEPCSCLKKPVTWRLYCKARI